LALSLGVLSFGAFFIAPQNLKTLASAGIGSAATLLIATEIISSGLQREKQESDDAVSKLQSTVTLALKERDQVRLELSKSNSDLELLRTKKEDELTNVSSHFQTLKNKLDEQKETLQNQVISLQSENSTLRGELKAVSNFTTEQAYSIIKNSYEFSIKQLDGTITAHKRNYPDLIEFFEQIENEVLGVKKWSLSELENYQRLNSFEQLIDVGLELSARIINKCFALKIKCYTYLIRYFQDEMKDSIPLQQHELDIEAINDAAINAIESYKSQAQNQIESIAKNFVYKLETLKQNYQEDYTQAIETAKLSIGKQEKLVEHLATLENELASHEVPQLFTPATREDYRIANKIIEFLYNQGIILDKSHSEYKKHSALCYFQPRQNIALSDLNNYSEKLMRHSGTIAPVIFKNTDTGLIVSELAISTKEQQAKAEDMTAKIPTCKSIVETSSRGFLITGHPGSGKSSAMRIIGQWLGGEEAMKLALIPHADDVDSFERSGFTVIGDKETIYVAIRELNQELLLRGQDGYRRKLLIICIDELASIIKDAPKGLEVMEVLRQAAVEGRKLNIIVLLGNHSQTTTAIDMDSQYREAFVQLFLVGAATHKLNMPNAPQLKQYESDWIQQSAYPCLVAINGKYQACQHPTHSAYNRYQDKGLPPIGIADMEQVSIAVGGFSVAKARKRQSRIAA
jgi:hypothetical protein